MSYGGMRVVIVGVPDRYSRRLFNVVKAGRSEGQGQSPACAEWCGRTMLWERGRPVGRDRVTSEPWAGERLIAL